MAPSKMLRLHQEVERTMELAFAHNAPTALWDTRYRMERASTSHPEVHSKWLFKTVNKT